MMYLYSIQCMSVDYVNFYVTVLLFVLLGGQTKEASLFSFCLLPTPRPILSSCSVSLRCLSKVNEGPLALCHLMITSLCHVM